MFLKYKLIPLLILLVFCFFYKDIWIRIFNFGRLRPPTKVNFTSVDLSTPMFCNSKKVKPDYTHHHI